MRRPTSVLVAGAALLVTLVAGCGSGARHAITTSGATPLATAPVTGGAAADPTGPGGQGGALAASRSAPASGQQTVSGTISYGWIIGVTGQTTVRVELARHITNSGKDQAATQYLRTHGGTVPSETQLRYVNVDLGKTKTFTMSSSATFVTNRPGGGQQKLDVAEFHAWLAAHLAKPIPVAVRQSYQGAPGYDGPLWMLTARGSVIVSISEVA